ncbi:MAG: sigma-70 family RNA polymerase sigma factor [Planctomycetes bacterium]|nr:sigma-70 family RNA polymerase sigma factor [Planctomycetota bacterium]
MSQYFDSTAIETPTTADLVRAAQTGDRDAFGRLAVRFERMVYATALRRLRNASEASELCQDVLMQAMQKIGQLRQPERFGGWLRSITANMAVNRLTRRPQAHSVDPEILESACAGSNTPESFAMAREERQRVRDGLGRLREMDRRALEAFYLDGQSLREMSDRFASPVGTIKRRLHVARKRLAAELEEPVAV